FRRTFVLAGAPIGYASFMATSMRGERGNGQRWQPDSAPLVTLAGIDDNVGHLLQASRGLRQCGRPCDAWLREIRKRIAEQFLEAQARTQRGGVERHAAEPLLAIGRKVEETCSCRPMSLGVD